MSGIRVQVTRQIELLARGVCRLGVDIADITPSSVEPMAGFSWSGSRGHASDNERLWARALCIEDSETRQCAVLCIVDLLSASAALLSAVERELAARGHESLVGRVILSGTHTPTAPGRFFGNRLQDRLAAPPTFSGFNARLTQELGVEMRVPASARCASGRTDRECARYAGPGSDRPRRPCGRL